MSQQAVTEAAGPEARSGPHRGRSSPGLRFLQHAGGFWLGSNSGPAWLLTASFLALLLASFPIKYAGNAWQKYFFDALENMDAPTLWRAIWLIALIVLAAAAIAVLQIHAQTRLKLRWRTWLTERLIARWLSERRFYRLSTLHHGETPEARIAEDGRVAIELLVDLAGGVIISLITAVGFIGVLWWAAGSLVIFGFEIPGYMVLVSVIYSLALSGLTWLTARPLVRSVEQKGAAEARFRYELTRVRDAAEPIALINGENDERALLDESLREVVARWYGVIRDRARVGLINASNTALVPITPLLLMAPKYASGEMTLGDMMLVAGAFIQVQTALGWLSDNAIFIADWFGSARRVAGLHDLLDELDATSARAAGIIIGESPDDAIRIENLSIALSNGDTIIEDASVTIGRGEKVLFKGASGSGKSTFIRALAGLWPWGEGTILMPAGAAIAFIPQRPYLPPGPLREALAYPAGDHKATDAAMKSILSRCGLRHLADRLDAEEDWSATLSPADAQRIGFCRALLAKPDILILDEPTSALDEPSQSRLMELLATELPAATILHAGLRPGLEAFHTREIAVVRKDAGSPGSIVNRPLTIVGRLREILRRGRDGDLRR